MKDNICESDCERSHDVVSSHNHHGEYVGVLSGRLCQLDVWAERKKTVRMIKQETFKQSNFLLGGSCSPIARVYQSHSEKLHRQVRLSAPIFRRE